MLFQLFGGIWLGWVWEKGSKKKKTANTHTQDAL